jgi:predicted RNase H-like HicB family nuclease
MDKRKPIRKEEEKNDFSVVRREKLMMLRCTIASKGDRLFVGKCLELGVCSQGKTEIQCKRNLFEAIEAYIEAARQAKSIVEIRPVSYYPVKKIIFDIHYGITQAIKLKNNYFKTERSVPVGI